MHRLRQHQECTRHQEQEDVEEEKGLEKQEVREHASAKTSTHSLERYLPQLERVQEGQPAVPAVSDCLWGVRGKRIKIKSLWSLDPALYTHWHIYCMRID